MKRQSRCLIVVALSVVLAGSLFLASCTTSNKETYTVVFRDSNGAVLDSQCVSAGQAAIAPQVQEKDGAFFLGWDMDFSCVHKNLYVTAQRITAKEPTIAVASKKASPGEAIEIPVAIIKNPGVAGAKITLSYDTALAIQGAKNGDAFAELYYTMPGQFENPCSFTWDSESGVSNRDGHFLWITFLIPGDAEPGTQYMIGCSYQDGDIYDEELQDIMVCTFGGVITVT